MSLKSFHHSFSNSYKSYGDTVNCFSSCQTADPESNHHYNFVTFFSSSSLKISDTKCGSFFDSFSVYIIVFCLSSLTGIEDILVKPGADHKRKKIIERSRQGGIEVSLFCRFVFPSIMQNF